MCLEMEIKKMLNSEILLENLFSKYSIFLI